MTKDKKAVSGKEITFYADTLNEIVYRAQSIVDAKKCIPSVYLRCNTCDKNDCMGCSIENSSPLVRVSSFYVLPEIARFTDKERAIAVPLLRHLFAGRITYGIKRLKELVAILENDLGNANGDNNLIERFVHREEANDL